MLRPSIEPFATSGGDLYLLDGGATARFVIRDSSSFERLLVQALDGTALTTGELAATLARARVRADVDEVQAAVDQLAALGLLHRVAPAPVGALGPAALERFDRQLAWLGDRFATRGEAIAAQERLADATVAVLGCGGLGCWTLSALACAGIGAFVIVDDDIVELSNLNRQILFAAGDVGRPKVLAAADALRRFSPQTVVDARGQRLGSAEQVADVVAGCAFVVETADRPMYEMPRWVDSACRHHGIPHMSAAQHPPLVRVGPLRIPGRSACLECVEAADRARYPLLDELAAFRAARSRPVPTLGAASGLIGTLIATDIVHLLSGAHPPATLDRSLVFDLATFETRLEPESVTECRHSGSPPAT